MKLKTGGLIKSITHKNWSKMIHKTNNRKPTYQNKLNYVMTKPKKIYFKNKIDFDRTNVWKNCRHLTSSDGENHKKL